jgi:hypothetical protein
MVIATFLMLLPLSDHAPVQAQTDDVPPYLYYYSRLLGGLIIERADGTDSRQIAADIIPPGMTGISGPGWSPSGRYFAAYGVTFDGYNTTHGRPYLIDGSGVQQNFVYFHYYRAALLMQWSPANEDVLFVLTSFNGDSAHPGAMFWLIDIEKREVLAQFGANFSDLTISMSELAWDVVNHQVVFYFSTETLHGRDYFRVTMHYNGTTLRERIEEDEFVPLFESSPYDFDSLWQGIGESPSGIYQARGYHPSLVTNIETGEVVELPQHTQGTICADYVWNDDEQYIIKLNGTLEAGGGCQQAVMGVTDSQAHLWRELGDCWWDAPACAGWLPANVDMSALPLGSPTPVQLDPVRIEYTDRAISWTNPEQVPTLRLRCGENGLDELVDPERAQVAYFLRVPSCPGPVNYSIMNEGLVTAVAHNATYDLLATYVDIWGYVSIWARSNEVYEEVLRLTSQGFMLEFTEDDEYLRARNRNAWKVYAVADILAAIDAQVQSAYPPT